jgi:hypothetical protein
MSLHRFTSFLLYLFIYFPVRVREWFPHFTTCLEFIDSLSSDGSDPGLDFAEPEFDLAFDPAADQSDCAFFPDSQEA